MCVCVCVCVRVCLRATAGRQLEAITDRMVKSLDFDINGFFSEIDRSLEASRRVFRRLDSVMMALTEADWLRIEAKVSTELLCPAVAIPRSVCPNPRRAAALRYRHADCGPGRRSAASLTAVVSPPQGDNLLCM